MNSLLSTIHTFQNNSLKKPKTLLTCCAAVFFGWILAIPFDGLIVRELFSRQDVHIPSMSLVLMSVHFLGLLTGAWLVKNLRQAWQVMMMAVVLCLGASFLLFLPLPLVGYPALMVMAYFSGTFVAAWGQPLQAMIPTSQRFTTVIDVLIFSNLLMIAVDVVTVAWDLVPGKILSLLLLIIAMASLIVLGPAFVSFKTVEQRRLSITEKDRTSATPSLLRPFVWLCVFITLITLNSGVMYQVVTPTFAHLPLLTSFYWAIPYVAALVFLRSMPEKANRSNTLYVALAMMGLGYLFYGLLPSHAGSFILIYTLMLGALGVFDLFWWSLMASFLDYSKRPAMILGVGLSTNVLGIFLGGVAGNAIHGMPDGRSEISLAAFAVIFVGLALLPVVNRELRRVFQYHIFLVGGVPPKTQPALTDLIPENQGVEEVKEEPIENMPDTMAHLRERYQLTEREEEIISFLRKGYTYRAIGKILGITEHTIKFHTRNIYQKMNTRNKMELIRKLAAEQDQD